MRKGKGFQKENDLYTNDTLSLFVENINKYLNKMGFKCTYLKCSVSSLELITF